MSDKPKRGSERSGLIGQVTGLTGDLSRSAMRSVGKRVGGLSLRIGKTLILTRDQLREFSPEQRTWMRRAGEAIHDAREVAGLTIDDINEALDLEDKTLLQAIEQGSATVSFELILRLTALLARHDPVPFLINMIRGFNPQLWALLEDWGFGHLPTLYERERQWLNVYRRSERARKLSQDEFDKVLDFSRSAFEMALEFIDREDRDKS
ncbi:MAG: hypothetical protein ACQES2_03535 [Pseudomonadota bacterium]